MGSIILFPAVTIYLLIKKKSAEAPELAENPIPDGQRVSDKRHKYQEQIDILNNKDCEFCCKPRRICECEIDVEDYFGKEVDLEEMFDIYEQAELPMLDDEWARKVTEKYDIIFDDKITFYALFLIDMKEKNKEITPDNFNLYAGWDYRKELENKFQRNILLESITDISGVSDKIARTILDQYSTTESIKSATEEELIEIPGVGKGLAKAIKARIG